MTKTTIAISEEMKEELNKLKVHLREPELVRIQAPSLKQEAH